MTWDENKWFLLFGFVGIVTFVGSLLEVSKKGKKRNSNYYMNENTLIRGMFLVICFLFYVSYLWAKSKRIISWDKDIFFFFLVGWFGIAELVVGWHGLHYRKKINNSSYDRFSEASFYGSILILIGIIVWIWLWGVPWDPHIIFEWQKNPQEFLNKPIF